VFGDRPEIQEVVIVQPFHGAGVYIGISYATSQVYLFLTELAACYRGLDK